MNQWNLKTPSTADFVITFPIKFSIVYTAITMPLGYKSVHGWRASIPETSSITLTTSEIENYIRYVAFSIGK